MAPTPPAPEPPPAGTPPDPNNSPLAIPAHALNPPFRYHSPQQMPAGANKRAIVVNLKEGVTATDLLPPSPSQDHLNWIRKIEGK